MAEESSKKRSLGGALKELARSAGPGLVAGVSDDDPSGVATYAQTGAVTGVGLLWTAPFSLPLMYAVQEICDRTAIASGQSLGLLLRRRFAGKMRWAIGAMIAALLAANIINAAADLAAIGNGMQLLGAGSDHIWAIVAGAAITAVLIAGSFELLAKILKWLCLVLFAYVGVLLVAKVPWAEVGAGTLGLRMTWNSTTVPLLVAVMGTTISPYMFFWQSGHRVELMRSQATEAQMATAVPSRFRRMRQLFMARIDVLIGMVASIVIMFAIIAATAATVGRNGPVQIATAADAAKALTPVAGPLASAVFAVSFIATGILAVPVLASSASFAVAGFLDKQWGFSRSPRKAPLFYGIIGAGTLGGAAIAYFTDNPVQLLVFSAFINAVVAGPFLIVIMVISHDKRIMGDARNGWLAAVVGWITTVVMTLAAAAGLYFTFTGQG